MKKIFLILSIGFLVMSCTKFLDVKPAGKLIPTKISEFDNLLYNSVTVDYHLMDYNKGSIVPCLSDMAYITDNVLKHYYTPTHLYNDRLAAYIFATPYQDFNTNSYGMDNGCYKAVSLFNNAIDGITGLGKEEDSYGKEVIAQARAGRAWSMFITGICFAQGFDPNGTNESKTIPYRMSSDPDFKNPDRATLTELYDLTQKDLEFAAEFAPKMVLNPTRANKATAHALLAFMYMHKSDYANMYKYSRLAWDMQLANYGGDPGNLIYNLNDFKYEVRVPAPITQPGEDVNTRLLLESPDQLHGKSYNRENMFHRIGMNSLYLYPTKENLDNFKPGDRRYELFMLKLTGFQKTYKGQGPGGTDVKVADGIMIIDYRKSKLGSSHNQGLTHPELLLMLAESAARMNKPDEAMAALRILRKYRYTPATAAIADMSGDALVHEVIRERLREFTIETPHRYWDLKRFAREPGKPWAKTSFSRVVVGEKLTVEINSDKFQLELGNLYRQKNPHWGLAPIPGVWAPYKFGNPLENL